MLVQLLTADNDRHLFFLLFRQINIQDYDRTVVKFQQLYYVNMQQTFVAFSKGMFLLIYMA